MKQLEPDAVERGVAALKRFRKIAESAGASMHAVATSTVREADNREEFLNRAREEAGVEVDVVSGAEEARLIHVGVLQAVTGLGPPSPAHRHRRRQHRVRDRRGVRGPRGR